MLLGENKKVKTIDVSTVTTSDTYIRDGLINVSRIEIQIDWISLSGTLDGVINIYQRVESSMSWVMTDSTEMSKILNTASGSTLFTMWTWTASDVKVEFVKNNLINGTINIALGARR